MTRPSFTPPSHQQGAALIVSLIFLSVLTMLGMTTLGTALLESRMAGNARDRNLAFQAGEIAMRDAESYIRRSGRIFKEYEIGQDKIDDCDGTDCDPQDCLHGYCFNGYTMKQDSSKDWTTTSVWDDGETYWVNALQYAQAGSSVAGSDGNARKSANHGSPVILTLNQGSACAQLVDGACGYTQPAPLPLMRRQPEYLIEGFCKNCDTEPRFFYRITVRAYGMRNGTRVLLQEVYTPW